MKLTGRSRGFVVAVLGERRRAAKTGHRAVDLPLLGPILLGSAKPKCNACKLYVFFNYIKKIINLKTSIFFFFREFEREHHFLIRQWVRLGSGEASIVLLDRGGPCRSVTSSMTRLRRAEGQESHVRAFLTPSSFEWGPRANYRTFPAGLPNLRISFRSQNILWGKANLNG